MKSHLWSDKFSCFNYIVILLLFFCPFHGSLAKDFTLKEAFSSALELAEPIKVAEQRTQQTEERLTQARGGLWPSLKATSSIQRVEGDPADQTTSKLTLSQPLFRGFGEYGIIDSRHSDLQAAQESARLQRQTYLEEVARSFFLVIETELNLDNLKQLASNLLQRVAEIKRQVHIGRARQTDLFSSQAQWEGTQAQINQLQQELALARLSFEQHTGVKQAQPVDSLRPTNLKKSLSENEIIGLVEKTPNFIIAQRALEKAKSDLRVARAGHWPTMDLEGSYYFQRSGIYRDSHWEVGLSAKLSLFEGGIIASKVRESLQEITIKELDLAALRKKLLLQLATLAGKIQIESQKIDSLTVASEWAKKSYQGQLRDYKVGLISYLEAIQSEKSYWELKKDLDLARVRARLAEIQFGLLTGELL